MSLTRINHNISSINAQRNLEINSSRIGRSIERLASGLRINRGADDPAGLVISELLRAQVSGLDVAEQNASQGVNLIKTAEGALDEVSGLLRQMRDLAVDAASDSNKNADARAALQAQVESALSTIDEIAVNTKYAGRALLNGSAGTKVNIIDNSTVTTQGISTLGDQGDGYISVQVTTAAEKAYSDSGTGGAVVGGNTVHGTGGIDLSGGGDSLNLYVNGVQVQDGAGALVIDSTTTWNDVVTAINTTAALDGEVTAEITGGELRISSDAYGSDQHISVEYSGTATSTTDLLVNASDATFEADNGLDAVADVAFGGNALDGGNDVTFDAGSGLTVSHATYGSITLTESAGTTVADYTDALYAEDGQLSFQIGYGAGETASTSIRSMKTSDLGQTSALSDIDISTVDGANAALTVIDEAINQVSTVRGDLGAFQVNELEAESRSLAVARENLAASESQIRDTDFGREMAEFTTSQVLVQSATAFLAQANALPQQVLQLIAG
ncbi:MAG: flagellin, partial [Armatimonadota bacterium]|nr:flagellin [Armatimonadota bacterium]